MTIGSGDIGHERNRQILHEGWHASHDDQHADQEMLTAAILYAASCFSDARRHLVNIRWPWDEEWDKRDKHDTRRKLVIAGALIAAEIDRLDRETSRASD
jgi:hypothetical protein